MIFSEIYGSYYKAMSEILKLTAGRSAAVLKDFRPAIQKYAFSESPMAIESAITEERWQVIRADGVTAIANPPSRPMSTLEKRWLKAISLDPRMKLFNIDFSFLGDTEPLFKPDDYCVYDRYADGDPYEDPDYIQNFRLILASLKDHHPLCISILNRNGKEKPLLVRPEYLEYSEKDDKFRLVASGTRFTTFINLGRIQSCRLADVFHDNCVRTQDNQCSVTLAVTDERNALQRVLLHFSHFEKEAERIDEKHYRVKIKYDKDDETELVIRILSFGPLVKVTEPYSFADLIRKRLIMQKNCGL